MSKERPVSLYAHEVRAILDRRQSQFRRAMKSQPLRAHQPDAEHCILQDFSDNPDTLYDHEHVQCPYGQPGDRLWVREVHSISAAHGQRRAVFQRGGLEESFSTKISADGTQIAYYREGVDRSAPGRWRPPTNMPRWASRIDLEVTGVRVERLQDISEADALNEGAINGVGLSCVGLAEGECASKNFAKLWESINGPGSWDTNPWVWVVEFQVTRKARG